MDHQECFATTDLEKGEGWVQERKSRWRSAPWEEIPEEELIRVFYSDYEDLQSEFESLPSETEDPQN
jgi:hypothetical protein